MIRNVLNFGDVTAEQLMVPRIRVDGVPRGLTLDELQEEVSRSQHSRYPVFSDSIDNVVGILHVKDLFSAIARKDTQKTAGALARRPVAFVPEGQLASTVLKEMRAGRHHMAVVVDEFGGVSGILTLEDLLEEIVGDIQDEHDLDDAVSIRMLSPHSALVEASTPVADINRAVGTELPEGDYISIGGLLVDYLGEVPLQGSTHDLLGLRVLIRESNAKRVARVELSGVPGTPRPLTSPPPSSSDH
jgi:magnesium and cobalt transporter